MARDEEENPDAKLARKSEMVAKKVSKPFWVSVFMLPVVVILFVVGLILLVNANEKASHILAEKPENKVDSFSKKISVTKDKASQQYNKHLEKMEDESIFTVNQKFRSMYQISKESEADYVTLVNQYQKLSYDMASRINGSGEWFYYFDQKVAKLLAQARERESEMVQYFKDE